MKTAIYRKGHFNAAHRLHNLHWNEEKNREVFGLCNNPGYHGHNYELVVKIIGELNPDTGYVMDMKELSQLIHDEVEERFDHKNLNLDTEEFRQLNPTVENICRIIYEILRKKINPSFDLQIRLYETPRNFAEYPA